MELLIVVLKEPYALFVIICFCAFHVSVSTCAGAISSMVVVPFRSPVYFNGINTSNA